MQPIFHLFIGTPVTVTVDAVLVGLVVGLFAINVFGVGMAGGT